MTTANAQNTACAVAVDILLMPKLSAITKPSGASMMTHLSGVFSTCSAKPELAKNIATTPVSKTADAM